MERHGFKDIAMRLISTGNGDGMGINSAGTDVDADKCSCPRRALLYALVESSHRMV